MLNTLFRGEKGLSRAIYRRARHLEKDVNELANLYYKFEEKSIYDSDDLVELAKKIEKKSGVIKDLADIIHKDFQMEFKHIKNLREVAYLMQKRVEKSGRFKDQELNEITDILGELKDEIETVINHLSRLERFEKPATLKGNLKQAANSMEEKMQENIRDVKNFAKKLRRIEKKVVKDEKSLDKDTDNLVKKSQSDDNASRIKEEILKETKQLHDSMKKEEDNVARMILYDLMDLYYIVLGAHRMVEKIEKKQGFPQDSKDIITKAFKKELLLEVKQRTEDLLEEARKVLSKEERAAA